MTPKANRALFRALLAAATLSPAAQAATLYWDGADTSGNPDGGAGTWNATGLVWDDAAAAGNSVAWADGSDAVFAGTAGTVTVDGTFSLASLSLTGGYTLTGGTLGLGGGTLTTSATGSGTGLTIASVLSGSGGLTIAAHGDTSASGGGVGGSLALTGANTFTGGVTITSGVVDINSSFGDASNVITLNGGGLVDKNVNFTLTRNLVIGASGGVLRGYGSTSNVIAGNISGTGLLRRTDGGTSLLTGNWSGSVSYQVQRGVSILTGLWNSTGTVGTDGGYVGFARSASLGTSSTYLGLASAANQSNSRGWLIDSSRVVAGRSLRLDGAAAAPILGSSNLSVISDLSGVHPSYTGTFSTAGSVTSRNGGFHAPNAAFTLNAGHTLDAFGGPVWVGSLTGSGTLTSTGVSSGSTGRLGGLLPLVYAGSATASRSGALVGRINDATFVVGSLGTSTSFTGSINGSASLLKRGAGTLTITAAGGSTGTYVVEQGILRISGVNFGFPGEAKMGTTFAVYQGGVVEAAANYPFSQNQTAYILGGTLRYVSGDIYAPQLILDGGRIEGNGFRFGYNQNHSVNVLSARGASTIAGNLNLYNNSTTTTFRVEDGAAARDLVVSGQLNDAGGYGGQRLVKTGLGTMALLSTNSRSGGTTLQGGTLEVAAAGALGSGATAGVTLQGGTLRVDYALGGTLATQTFDFGGGTLLLTGNTGAVTQGIGATTISNGSSTISAIPGAGGATTVNLGSITRSGSATRGLLNLNGTATWTTTQANDGTGKLAGVLLGGALAANDGAGNIVKFAGTQLASNFIDSSTADLVIGANVTGNLSLTAAGTTTVGSLSLDGTAAGRTIDIAAGNTLRVTGGLFQVSSGLALNVGGAGTLTGGSVDNAASDLLVNAMGGMATGVGMAISSAIGNNGTGAVTLVKGGVGSLSLTGANTFSGGLLIQQGRVIVTSDSTAGAGAITVNDGGQLYLNGTLSRAVTLNGGIGPAEGAGNLGALRLEGGSTLSGALTVARDSQVTVWGSGTANLTGAVTLTGALYKTGTGTLNLTGQGTNSGTGTLFVKQGVAQVGLANTYNSVSYDAFVDSGARLVAIGINSWQGNLVTVAAGGVFEVSGAGTSGAHNKFRNINLLGGSWIGTGGGKYAGEDGGFAGSEFTVFVGGSSRSLIETPNKIALSDTRFYVQDSTGGSAPDLLVKGSFVGTGYLGGLGTTRFERRVGGSANSNHTATMVVQAGHTLEFAGDGAMGSGTITLDGGRLRATSLDGLAEYQITGTSSMNTTAVGTFRQVTVDAARANSTSDFGDNTTWSYRGRLVVDSTRTLAFRESIDDAAYVRVWGTATDGTVVDQVILNDGQWNVTTTGTVTLGAGTYNLDVRAQNGGGGAGGFIQWDPNGGTNWSAVGIPTVAGLRLVSELGISQTVSNALTLNRRSEIEVLESADTLTLSGIVSGAGMLEKTGAGTLVLSNSNTFSGGITVAGGTLAFSAAANLGLGGVNLLEGSTLSYGGSSALTLSTPVSVELGNATIAVASETGALTLGQGVDNYLAGAAVRDVTKTGAGTLVVAGASTGANRFVVNAGTLSVTSTDASRASASVGASGTLSVASATFGAITNAGSATAASTTLGALTNTAGTLAAANATTVGALAVSGGALSLAAATQSGNIAVTGGSLTAGVLATAGTVNVSAGSASLGAASTGAVTLSGGTLALAAGATLASIEKTGGSLLVAGNAAAGVLNVTGNADLGGILRFDLSSNPSSGNDRIVAGGAVSLLDLTGVDIGLLGGSLATGEYILISGATVAEPITGLGLVSITGIAAGESRQTLTLSSTQTANALSLIVDGSVANLAFANGGTATGVWSNSSDDTVWSNGGAADRFYAGDVVSFGDLAGVAAQTVTLSGDLSPGAVTFANTAATTYTLAGTGSIVGVSGLTVSGGGRVVLANTGTNTYSGATTVTSGTLELGSAAVLSANSATVVNGGTLDVAAVASAVAGTVTLSSGSIVGTTGSLAASSLTVTGGLLDANLAGAGSLTFSGAGATFAYAKAATHTGGTTLAAGTLNLSGSLAGTLAQSAGTTLNLSGSVGGALTLAVGASADISATGAANGGVTLTGSLAGGSTLTSAGAIAGGATLGRSSTLTSSGSLAGGATIATGATLVSSGQLAGNIANSGTLRFAGTGDIAYAGVISGGSTVEKTGAGSVTLSGTAHGIATLALQQGRLAVNTGSGGTWNNTLNSANITLANGTTLAFGNNTSLNGNISFAGDASIEVAAGTTVWKDTSGVMGTNSAGATFRKTGAGTLVIGTNNMGFGAGAQVVVDQGTLQLNKSNWYSGNILGQATLTINSGGTVDMTGYHVFDAFSETIITINGGAFISSNNQGYYAGGFNMTGGTMAVGVSNIQSIVTNASAQTAVISGNLGYYSRGFTATVADGEAAVDLQIGSTQQAFTKAGAGWMRVAGVATDRDITITGGTLEVGGGGTTGAVANVAIGAATSLRFNRSDDISHAAVLSGAGAVVHAGTGKLTLSGANTFGGGLTLAGGTLVLGSAGAGGTGGLTVATASANLEVANGVSATRTTLGGTGDLTKSGAGALTFTGASSLAGNLAVTEGSLTLAGADSLGHSGTVSVAAGASLSVGASVADLGAAQITNAGTLTVAGSTARSLSNSGAVTVSAGGGLGAVTLASGSVTSAGTLGAVALSGTGTLTSTGTVGAVTATAGALRLAGTAGAVSISGETVLNVGGLNATGALTAASLTVLDGSFLQFEISDPSASAFQDRIVLSGGVLDLSGITTGASLDVFGFSRGTGTRGSATVFNRYADYTVNLISGASQVLGDVTALTFAIDGFGDGLGATGTWSLVQVADGINLVYAGIDLPESLITVGSGLTQGLGDSQAGMDFLSGPDETVLVKGGAGRLTVTEALAHIGGTKVNEGILLLSGPDAALGEGDVTLATGTSLELGFEGNLANNIAGAGAIRKVGSAATTLSGILANTGGIFVDAGTLGTNFAPYASTVTVAAGATADFLGDAAQTFAGNLAGAGTVTIRQSRVVTLAGSNAGFTGLIDVQSGGVVLAADQAAGSGTVQVASGASAAISGARTLGSLITGSGTLAKDGDGVATLTVAPTLTGAISVNSGTLRGDFSLATGAIAVASGATLDFSVAGAASRGAADITGAGALAKTGAGTLTLTSAPGVTGGIRVEEGVLSAADFGAASAVAVSSGATAEVNLASDATLATAFTGSGTFRKAGSATLTVGATGLSGFGGKVRLAGGNLAVSSSSNFGSVSGADAIQLAGGNLAFTQGMTFGLGVQVSSLGGRLDASALGQTGTVTLSSAVSGTGELIIAGSGNTSAGGGGDAGLGVRLTNAASNFVGDLRIVSGLVSYASANVLGDAANRIVFDGGGILDNNQNLSLSRNMHVTANGGVIRFWGSNAATYSGALTGVGELRRTDGGTSTFTGDLSGFTGTLNNQSNSVSVFSGAAAGFGAATVNINGGTVAFASPSRVGSATVRLDGGTLRFDAAGTYAPAGLQLVADRGATLNSNGNAVTLGTLSGTGGSLTKTGAGELTLASASAAVTGALNVNSGALRLSAGTLTSAGGTLSNGATLAVQAGATHASTGTYYIGTGTLEISGGTLNYDSIRTSEGGGTNSVINQTGGVVNITGSVIQNERGNSFQMNHWSGSSNYNLSGGTLNVLNTNANIGWDGSAYITQTGGTANLRGVNFASGRNNAGGYTLSGGRLNVGVGGITAASNKVFTAGNATLGAMADWTSASAITLNGATGTVIDTTDSVSGVTGRTVTLSGALSGTGKLITSGAGTVVLSGANTNSGAIQVDAGTLRVTGTLRGGAAVTVATGATLELNATNIFVGGHGTALAATQTLTANGGSIVLGSGFDARLGNLTLNGGTLTSNRGLGGWDAYLADTTAGAASITVGGAAASLMNGSGGIHLGSNVRFDVADATGSSAADLLVTMRLDNGGNAGGIGSITKLGSGTLVLDNAANSFTGGMTIEAGVVRVASAGSLSTGDITLTGGLLDLGNLAFAGNINLNGGMVINTAGWTGTGTVNPAFTVDPAFLASLGAGSTFTVLPNMTADIAGIAASIDYRGGTLQGVGAYAGSLGVSGGTLDLAAANPLGTLSLSGTGVIDFGGRATDIDIAYSGGSLLNAGNYTGDIVVSGATTTLVAGTLGGGTVVAGNGRLLVFGANFANNVRLVGGSVLNLQNFAGTLFVGAGSSVNLGNIAAGTETVTLAALVLENGGTLSGEGTLAALTLDAGGVLAVGNSPGVITTTGNLTLNGGTQRFEVRNALDTLTDGPSTPGEDYDVVQVQGTLDLSGLSAQNRFLLELISLTETNALGALADFDPAGTYDFTLYDYATLNLGSNLASGINSLFTLDADGFLDMNGDQVDANLFSVRLDTQNSSLVLHYGVVPEPSTYGLVLGGLALALSAWRRRRKPATPAA